MSVNKLNAKTGIPSGNTAGRPTNPVIGDTYYNGQVEALEIYNGTTWKVLKSEGFPPDAPTISSVTDSSTSIVYSSTAGTLDVVFVPAATGGTPTQYNAFTTAGGHSGFTTVGTTVVITGLTPGTAYTVYGNAQNSSGTSTNTANASPVTPTTLPQAPTIGTSTAASASVTLTFTAGNTGGKSISNYKYSTDGTTYTAFSPAQTTSPLSITGLTNGTSYTFRIKAVNANGDSIASSAYSSVTPQAPTITGGTLVTSGGFNYRIFTSNLLVLSTSFNLTSWQYAQVFYELQTKSTGGLVPQFKENQMKSKIITFLIEGILAIVIFGGIGVLLAWRG